MKRTFLVILIVMIFQNAFSQKIKCVIVTEAGKIKLELFPEKAPLTVANFLKYIDSELYNRTTFYRVCTPENEKGRTIKIEVIQGGDVPEEKQFAPVKMETTKQTGIRHRSGTLSMARDTPDSATSSFFICIGNQAELDFAGKRNPDGQGFAAFGHVTKGMKVVRKIQSGENKGQYLLRPVKIILVKRLQK